MSRRLRRGFRSVLSVRIETKTTLLVVLTGLAVSAVMTAMAYASARRQYMAGIDRQLNAVAAALPRVLGEPYLTDALKPEGIAPDRYVEMVQTLNGIADRAGVYYVYAFAKHGDNVIHLATSASEDERRTGEWSAFAEPYEQPPPELLDTFVDGQPRFAEYSDEFGSFRSIFVASLDHRWVIGVDVSLKHIQEELRALVWRHLAIGAGVAALAGIAGRLLARRLARPLVTLSAEVDAWAARDFATDKGIRESLERLARRNRDEVGDLASRFVGVQDRLQEHLRNLADATAAREKIVHQLEIARTIQEGLLPQKLPAVPNFEITGWSKAADQTGGDYYDWIELSNGNLLLTIGDVTGHGIGPALVTAASRAYARASVDNADALDATIGRLNELLHVDLQGERFVTLVACVLNPAERMMKLVAAGHGPLLYYSRKKDEVLVSLDTHGLPLGVTTQFGYDAPLELNFEPGDTLVLVSDGIFEWMNAASEQFGSERLSASVLAACRATPDAVVERVLSDLAAFHQGTPQLDDTTALVVRCVG